MKLTPYLCSLGLLALASCQEKPAVEKQATPETQSETSVTAPATSEESTYLVTMTGVTCGGCQSYVRGSFKDFQGFKSIKFADGTEKGTQAVTVIAAEGVTKEQAIAALGKKANTFVVKDFASQ